MSETAITPLNPVTLEALPTVPVTPIDELPGLVTAAREAGHSWSSQSVKERASRLNALGRLLVARRAEGAAIISAELGRPEAMCQLAELNNTASYFSAAVAEGLVALKPVKVKLSPLDFPGKKAVVEMLPRGVIGVIAPWNYPLNNLLKSAVPALLAGNALIIKPSEQTPASAAWFASLADEVLGSGVVRVVQGRGDLGAALIESGVDAIVFTGSVPTGRKVAELAAKQLIPCSLELGGKDAAIVLSDANLDRTALGIAQWSMFNSGQDCASIERVYVEAAIADAFLEKLAKVVSRMRVSDGNGAAELGPLQNARQLEIVSAHIADAVKRGAKVVVGGEPTGVGYGFQPTILDNCSHEMSVMTEETFGPVVAVCRVSDADEAVRLANESDYGLNGSVWSTNLVRGERLARQLKVGVALVNNHSFTGTVPQTPWTGVKDTGPGVAASRWSYGTFCRPRTVVTDKGKDPDPFWFPADESLDVFLDLLARRNLGGGIGVLIGLAGQVGKRVKAIRNGV